MNKFGKKISLVFVGKVISYALTVLIAIKCTKIYGTSFYGQLAYVLSLSNILSSFYSFGFSNNIEKLIFTESDREKIANDLKIKLRQLLVVSPIICLTTNLIYISISVLLKTNIDLITIIAINISLIRAILLVIIRAFRSLKNYSLYALGELPHYIIFFIIIITIKGGIFKILLFLLGSWSVLLLVYAITMRNKYLFNWKIIENKNLAFSQNYLEQFRVMLNSNLVVLGENLPIIILKFIDLKMAGIFDILKKVVSLPVFILPVTNSIIGPYSLKYFAEKRNKEFQKIALKVSIIGFILTVLYFGLITIDLYVNEGYLINILNLTMNHTNNLVLVILMVGFLIHVVSGANNLILNLNGREKDLLLTNFYGLILFLISATIFHLYNFNSLLGIAISCSVYYLFINYRNLILIKLRFGVRMSILQL